MRARDRWYEYVPPASAVIPCEGEQHRVTWRWGKLKLEDHDLGGERAMLVLGGEPCPCLRALQLWADQFGMRPDQFAEVRRRMGPDAVLLPDELAVPRQAGIVLSLERAWRRSRYFDQQGRIIEAEVRNRAMPALRAHLNAAKQRFGSRVVRQAQVRHVAAGQAHKMEGRMDSVSVSASVALSSDWIVAVWATGLAEVEGFFVLDVTGPGSGPGRLALRAARWEPSPHHAGVAEPVTVAAEAWRDESGWGITATADHR